VKKYPILTSLLLTAIFLCSTVDAYRGFYPDLSEQNFHLTASAAIQQEMDTTFQIPFFGQQDARNYSLPVLAVILGLMDGFNPCAMWVLVYLISLIMSLNKSQRQKKDRLIRV
jgi:hypothetical protein